MGYLKGILLAVGLIVFGLFAFILAVLALLVSPVFPKLRFEANYFFLGPFGWFARFIVGVKLRFIHRERLAGWRPAVFIGNHQSGMDLGIIGTACPRRSVIVAKKEIQNIPIFGWFFKIAGNLMIDRKKTFEAKTQMEAIREVMKKRDLNLVIFPEGTRSKTQNFLPFKKGAFHLALATGFPIVPVICSTLTKKAVWETFDLRGGNVIISVLDAIPTQGLGVKDVDALKERVRAVMLLEYERINQIAEEYDRDPAKAKAAWGL